MKTVKMTTVVGINEGYSHNNEKESIQPAIKAWMDAAKEVFDATGVYVSATARPTSVLYNTEWGCPENGEKAVEFTTTANPEFVKDFEVWKNAALLVVKAVKKELKQSTVTVEILELSDFVYLND